MPRGAFTWDAERDQQIRIGLANEKMVKQIAAEMGLSAGAVQKRMARLGIKRPERISWSSAQDEMLRRLKRERMTWGEIAKKMRRTPRACRERLWRLNTARARMVETQKRAAGRVACPNDRFVIGDVKAATVKFELAFCDWADRHGIEICGYEAAA